MYFLTLASDRVNWFTDSNLVGLGSLLNSVLTSSIVNALLDLDSE